MERNPKLLVTYIYYVITGLKNCVHAHVPVCTIYAKALERTHKDKHAKFEITFISTVLESHFTEMFCYCFIETSFVVQLKFCGDTRGACSLFCCVPFKMLH